MAVKQLERDLWLIPGLVNVYILDTQDGLAVIDTGFPGRTPKILAALDAIGKTSADVRHMLLTHCHPDHIGSAAALQRATGATVWAHRLDAPMMEAGTTMRQPMCASPGWRNRILAKLLAGKVARVEPVKVDRFLDDGESPAFAPDLTTIHLPGHCQGQIAFLWARHGGVLFPADACVNRRGLTLPVGTEEPQLALASLDRLRRYSFDKICVMHGKPIMRGGGDQLRATHFDTFKKRKP
ncbi:MBL fold metallo-hydrolase [Novosphingobium terrae]|uniref:MBL fold metallo-hydrolase n=1 Tax=Novosphingobium terrae TaxID=2726189 RepID=UPI00197D32C4|nr:MBL fold metallo-hydrolase [Novosphingobium terrae]